MNESKSKQKIGRIEPGSPINETASNLDVRFKHRGLKGMEPSDKELLLADLKGINCRRLKVTEPINNLSNSAI